MARHSAKLSLMPTLRVKRSRPTLARHPFPSFGPFRIDPGVTARHRPLPHGSWLTASSLCLMSLSHHALCKAVMKNARLLWLKFHRVTLTCSWSCDLWVRDGIPQAPSPQLNHVLHPILSRSIFSSARPYKTVPPVPQCCRTVRYIDSITGQLYRATASYVLSDRSLARVWIPRRGRSRRRRASRVYCRMPVESSIYEGTGSL
ncbi:hypothetical protein L226DRAFT_285050 [Lentinus tigrinus ALCF2SS1-7]|uniref:uncharacterized protein n=1 Tax=Lentinus tigrinus ALCF2SS1-7 TaxID=1328758 RepID=UPI0011662628|nr:hypothetical protein L226DRAFT_285050 [Lentinus tigrinus ALCF2SS1-7]